MNGNRRAAALIGLMMFALSGCATVVVGGDQPRMREAIDALRSARAHLESAEPNKGGHREEAIRIIDAAIHETEEGIRFADERR